MFLLAKYEAAWRTSHHAWRHLGVMAGTCSDKNVAYILNRTKVMKQETQSWVKCGHKQCTLLYSLSLKCEKVQILHMFSPLHTLPIAAWPPQESCRGFHMHVISLKQTEALLQVSYQPKVFLPKPIIMRFGKRNDITDNRNILSIKWQQKWNLKWS